MVSNIQVPFKTIEVLTYLKLFDEMGKLEQLQLIFF